MSDDFHRPTLTFPAGAYNATQVRLYGIRAETGLGVPGQPAALEDTGISIESEALGELNDDELALFNNLMGRSNTKEKFGELMESLKATIPQIPITITYHLKVDTKKLGTIVIALKNKTETIGKIDLRKQLSCGIIVGYAYEGHTYDLPKPKIMLLPVAPEITIPLDDSGYKRKESENYAVWIVDKLDECVEFEMNQGFVEQLVLEANLPGKRAPTMYAGRMMMGHRSGRLSE
ncbi:hypothetical protein [Allomesorhizobium camelthorni]|uniref:Uncharacterized protein n=1 Tax=Allomesorhizobium camelthorni TaxID=475069 RepID=A0A6G4WD90_9HYPH|nr:hypothetical protein [Mesorhizobium camelthorni]NGO52163.1 hypothetical protein [Mesorhizobium camelthorni]